MSDRRFILGDAPRDGTNYGRKDGKWQAGVGGGISNVVEDTTPQLGGSLDVNGQKIVSVSNGNIDIEPNGTGNVLIGNFTFDADQSVGAGQDDYVLTYDNATGLISLEAASGGTSISDGTVSDSILYWNGSAWTENTNMLVDASGALHIKERTTAAAAKGAGWSQLWVEDTDEGTLKFQPDDGTDYTVAILDQTDHNEGYIYTWKNSASAPALYARQANASGPYAYFFQNGFADAVSGTEYVQLGPSGRIWASGPIFLKEAGTADADTTAYGQIWVKNDTPNSLYFTDDAGVDHDLTSTVPGSHTHTATEITDLGQYLGYGYTAPTIGSNYHYHYRNHATSPVLYARQASTGDICRFFQNPTAATTSGTSQVTIRNDGGITVTGEITRSGEGSHLYHGSSSYGSGSITVQNGGSPSGGANGDIFLIY